MRSSLSRSFLIGLCLISGAFTVVASLSAFVMQESELAHRQVSFLSEYVQERSDNLSHRFDNLMTLQRSAINALDRRERLMASAPIGKLLDEDMPLQPDGTRRSRPEAFEGEITSGGRMLYGMGAFVADGAHLSLDEKRDLSSAFRVVSAFGPAAHGDFDNFYFFTPKDRLVIFGPDRPDHLLFYRKTAPADLDFSQQEMVRTVLPAADPAGATRCTSLQHLIQDKEAARVATACVTPAYVGGRYAGAFGSTVNVTTFFADAVRSALPGSTAMIMRSDGQPLAYPGSMSAKGVSERQVAADSRRYGLAQLSRIVRGAAGGHGVVVSPDGRQIVAFARLNGPDWYFIVSYPAAAVAWSAARSASVILALGVLACVLMVLTVLRMARRTVIQPLEQLARSCEVRSAPASAALEGRVDEVGVLARALRGERDRADELLASLEQRVGERTAELEKANAEKSRFLANMSHELRTPLNGVIAVSETLAREQVTPRNVELAQLIVASGRLLEQVLTDVLDFSKIEAGEMRLERRPFELELVTSRVAELHRAAAEAKGVRLAWEMTDAARGAYLGDSVRLTQVLSNLLSNGVKFTTEGEVRLTVDREGGTLRFQVADTGIGFDEEAKSRLFHRFEQADVSIRRRFGGTGLGLAICRSLVSLMGGEIDAVSKPGEGAIFTVLLPLPRVEAAPAASPEFVTPDELPGLKVLLAEDHPTNQRVVRLILQAAGVALTVVDNGALALEAFAGQRFDLVLMDMQMPEMDGLTATSRIRVMESTEGAPRTPIIMLTANALDEHVSASLAAGADLHLSKPLRAAELLDAIATLTGGGTEPLEHAA